MITVRIGKKMYDVATKCPKCGKEKVSLSRYSDRIICVSCGNWIYTDEAVGTPWVIDYRK